MKMTPIQKEALERVANRLKSMSKEEFKAELDKYKCNSYEWGYFDQWDEVGGMQRKGYGNGEYVLTADYEKLRKKHIQLSKKKNILQRRHDDMMKRIVELESKLLELENNDKI